MLRVALVTHRGLPDLSADDHLVRDELGRRGASVAAAVWDDPAVEWTAFDRVVLRSCWDYHLRCGEFLRWVETLARCGVPLWNAPSLVRRNSDKSYLLDLQAQGVAILPTIRVARGDAPSLADVLAQRGFPEAVIKPAVSASAQGTWRTQARDAAAEEGRFRALVAMTDVLVQSYAPEIASDGEWSLVFLGGAYSHAVRKLPAPGDFRVQSELGGRVVPAQPPPALVEQARGILALIPEPWLYARVDGLDREGVFTLMELEMIEPALFLATCGEAPARFADAIVSASGAG
jgi:glutathione synthase/RimK-type ligase-like ATP-grasp enzyme